MVKRFCAGSRLFTLGLLLLLYLYPLTTQAFYNQKSPLGTNTNEIMEEDSSVPFIDLFKMALPFEYAKPLTKGDVRYDRNGWPMLLGPGAQASTRFANKLPASTIPQGYYTVLYDGQGKIEYGIDATLVESNKGKDIILLTPGADKEYSAKLTIVKTEPKNPLRNIRVLPPGGICSSNPFQRVMNASQCTGNDYLAFDRHYDKIIFNPDYLKFMRDYKVIRYMNMSGITRNPMSRWEERPRVEQATWGGPEGIRGAPLEVMIELSNRLSADAWFNLPHAANDDFVRRYARMIKTQLNPDLKVYIEYSNETWNGIFSQHAYMKRLGLQSKLDTEPMKAGYKYYSKRSVEIFRIFEQELGKQRLVRVMGGLTGSKGMTETMLGFNDAYKFTDAFAIAPYVFGDDDALRKARTVAQVFQIMTSSQYRYSLPKVLEAIREQAAVTNKLKVSLIAYEGGQHLVDWKTKTNDQHPNSLFYSANRHAQMETIYRRLLDGWKQAGGEMFVHYTSPRTYQKFGSFGTKEYITQPDNEAPKHLALIRFMNANPCWWQNCVNPVRRIAPRSMSELAVLERGATPAAAPATPAVAPTTPVAPAATPAPATPPAPTTPTATPPAAAATPPATPTPSPAASTTKIASFEVVHEAYIQGRAVAHTIRNMGNPWQGASTYRLRNVVNGTITGKEDLAAIWQVSWDYSNLYLRVAVDDNKFFRENDKPWHDDSIEVFFNTNATPQTQYDGVHQHHMIFRWGDSSITYGGYSARQHLNAQYAMKKFDNSYVLELIVPWPALGITPGMGTTLGIDIQVNDDDSGGLRKGKLSWNDKRDEAWRNPSMLGSVVLER
ncbi:sugar-binding protein [Thiofilum flexile]|uniref:sugar-binding protein n=1 Tax=Thiofilum flexile TaxID=125627 RepID=UPI000368A10E|nr:sugar-binding protein [Thiofilum flexile]